MPRPSICLIILESWQGFEDASGIKYVRLLHMGQYWFYNIIIIVTNIIILEFLYAQFVQPDAPQLTILSFLIRVRT